MCPQESSCILAGGSGFSTNVYGGFYYKRRGLPLMNCWMFYARLTVAPSQAILRKFYLGSTGRYRTERVNAMSYFLVSPAANPYVAG